MAHEHTADSHDHAHDASHHEGDHHGPAHGWRRWVYATNHKDIGTMYLVFACIMFFIGGFMAMIIRAELFQPGLQLVEPQFFNSMTTMHALVMIFGAVMPGARMFRMVVTMLIEPMIELAPMMCSAKMPRSMPIGICVDSGA